MAFYVYIVACGRNGTIYTGSTDNLAKRVWEHKTKARDGFSKTYGCDRLVWFEVFESRENAFRRERRIKQWRRDLYATLAGEPDPDGALGSGSRHSPG